MRMLTTAALTAALTLAPAAAGAATMTDKGWQSSTVTVVAGGTKSWDVAKGVAAWNSTDPAVTLTVAPKKVKDCAQVAGPCITVTAGSLGDGVGGTASVRRTDGWITSCHVTLADSHKGKTLKIYNDNILVHELGHCVGLDHAPFDADSIMVKHVTGLSVLQPYDLADLETLYG